MPTRNLIPASIYAVLGAIVVGIAGIFSSAIEARRRTGRHGHDRSPSSTWGQRRSTLGVAHCALLLSRRPGGRSYFLSALIDLFGSREHRPLAHWGTTSRFRVSRSAAFCWLSISEGRCGLDMFIQSNTYRPMFKYWSPCPVGSWALAILGFFAFLSFLAALAEDGPIRWSGLRTLRAPSPVGRIIAVLGGFFGFYVAGYTGVLLA